ANKPLTEVPAAGAKVTAEKMHDDVGVTEWTLGNGVRILLKPTDFKADEILFGAVSPGGLGHVSDEDIPSGTMAANIVNMGGVGDFDAIKLRKALTGKVASVNPFINGEYEGFTGSAAPKDLETALQLVYMYFHEPRKDTTAFESFKTRMEGYLANARNQPESVFGDTLRAALSNYHPRNRPMNEEWLGEMDLETAFNFYTERFRDASDFTFFFVGNFSPEELKPMVETWLGALPVTNRKESWKDPGVRPPKGVIKKEVHKGIEDKSLVAVIFTGDHEWSYENNYAISSLEELLTIRLREEIREEKGGTYGVGVNLNVDKYPEQDYMLLINFGTKPERVDELTGELFSVLNSVRSEPVAQETIDKIKEMQRRERETNLKENSWWMGQLQGAIMYNEPLNRWMQYDDMIKALDADMLMQAAKKYLNMDNYLQVVLYPEEKVDAASGEAAGE
ncbi:MAG: insulinase family protein, partial [Bacteroidota bacterium]|nr:insulinase family protein [Bacteroidota bacterium]